MQKTCESLDRSNVLLGNMFIQGKVSDEVLEKMYVAFPHLKHDENHQKRIKDASTHPDATDLEMAAMTARKWVEHN